MSVEDLAIAVLASAVSDLRSVRVDRRRSGARFFKSGDADGWARVAGIKPAALGCIVQRVCGEGIGKSGRGGVLVLDAEALRDEDEAQDVRDDAEPTGPPAAFVEAISHVAGDRAVAAGVETPTGGEAHAGATETRDDKTTATGGGDATARRSDDVVCLEGIRLHPA
jgi:hypothetical protein